MKYTYADLVDAIAEALLQTHEYGGSPEEREPLRVQSRMRRLKQAHTALTALADAGVIKSEELSL